MDLRALWKLGYGVYIIGARKGDKINAQIANTVFQITAEPPTLAVSINKKNLTWEYIHASQAFAAAVLCQETPLSFIGEFGFRSGRDTNKFEGVNYKSGITGSPIVLDNAVSYVEVRVNQEVDVGTHTIFIGEVVAAEVIEEKPCLSYEYYQQVKRGTTPKAAPTFSETKKEAPAARAAGQAAPMANSEAGPKQEAAGKPGEQGGAPSSAAPPAHASAAPAAKYRCTVCGYIYDPAQGDPDSGIQPGTAFESIPDTWKCPVCGADKSQFVKLEA